MVLQRIIRDKLKLKQLGILTTYFCEVIGRDIEDKEAQIEAERLKII